MWALVTQGIGQGYLTHHRSSIRFDHHRSTHIIISLRGFIWEERRKRTSKEINEGRAANQHGPHDPVLTANTDNNRGNSLMQRCCSMPTKFFFRSWVSVQFNKAWCYPATSHIKASTGRD